MNISQPEIDLIKGCGKLYIIGNGGSYANAVHIANDLQNCGICAMTLDPATLTATANDYDYAQVFSMWIEKTGRPNDMLVALSGSGRSPNILKAISAAKKKLMFTWAIFGGYNEHIDLCADILTACGANMQEAEEHQLVVGHELMRALRKEKP